MVKLQELKHDLGLLTLEDLKQAGIEDIDDEIKEEGVILSYTNDDYNKRRNEVTWVAAANTEDLNLVIITNGILYNKEQQKNTGRKVEVGRVYVDEEKAEMLLNALYHAFPDIFAKVLEEQLENDEDDEDEGVKNKLPKTKDYELISIDPLNEASSIDEAIGNLKTCIKKLERLKSKGFEMLFPPTENFVAVSNTFVQNTPEPAPDKIIDLHTHLKNKLGQSVQMLHHSQTDSTTYIASNPDDKTVKIFTGNLQELVKQNPESAIDVLEVTTIDSKLVRPLVTAIKKVFNKKM